MVDDAAAAAYRRYQEEEYERRILQQIRERPSNIMRIRTFEEAKDRWRAADGTSEGITERIDNEAQGVLRKHVLSLNRIRREEVEAMRGQSTAPPIKRWMRNGVNRVALSRVRPRRRSSDPECPVCLELLRADMLVAPCGHAFCETCLEAAFCKSVTCPMCRADCRAFATERGWAVEARPTRPRAAPIASRTRGRSSLSKASASFAAYDASLLARTTRSPSFWGAFAFLLFAKVHVAPGSQGPRNTGPSVAVFLLA